jgi:ATP-binding cassette subfamily B protein
MAGVPMYSWLKQAGAVRTAGRLLAAHTAQYVLWLLSWAIIGEFSLTGRMDRGWLLAWALLLMAVAPLRALTTWLQGVIAVSVGGRLKKRLLWGALRLEPEEIRSSGVGAFLGQALEAEAVETLALSGGIACLLSVVEIAISAVVLGQLALVLLFWCLMTALLGWRFFTRYRKWSDTRMGITQDLTEAMVGHRTRLAQQRPEEWHIEEDSTLDSYLHVSREMDRAATSLLGVIPRGWLLAGICALIPSVVAARTSGVSTAVSLGGVLLAFAAFRRLTGSLSDLAGAWVAWKRISGLFHAAERVEYAGEIPPGTVREDATGNVLEADRLMFRYRQNGTPVLNGCSLSVRAGDRVLLEGPSGGGKTTLASTIAGIRTPESGLILVNGLDRQTAGDARWRRQIAAAPQFHENHILTETLAFNLLMGRGWPPTRQDMEEAETICRDLGLGDLLDRMPAGMLQMVGEGGWQLSHGERSRIFIARALLQNADLMILDESFGALDPENLKTALETTVERAKTLMVIAHP